MPYIENPYEVIETLQAENAKLNQELKAYHGMKPAGVKMLEERISDLNSVCLEHQQERMSLQAENKTLRNELCWKCGQYREAHNGACNSCRWSKEST